MPARTDKPDRTALTTEHVLRVLLAVEAGECSEGQASELLTLDRAAVRDLRDRQLSHVRRAWAIYRAAGVP